MKLEHITGMQAGCTMGLDKEGRESLVVCLKGTYSLPPNGRPPVLLPEQLLLVEADQFSGEPGLSAPVYESDFAPVKPRCDILFNGGAYAHDLDLTTHNHGSPPGNSPPWPYLMGEYGSVVEFNCLRPQNQDALKASRKLYSNSAVADIAPLRRVRILGGEVICAGYGGQVYQLRGDRFKSFPILMNDGEDLDIEDITISLLQKE